MIPHRYGTLHLMSLDVAQAQKVVGAIRNNIDIDKVRWSFENLEQELPSDVIESVDMM